MPRNIELKARIGDWESALRAARSVATADLRELLQIDTYFRVANGRLKLREFGTGAAELIAYSRADEQDAKPCDYRVVRVDDAEGILAALTAALGILVCVEKRRLV